MNESVVNSNKLSFISISIVLALFLIIVDMLIILDERDYLLQTERRHVSNELDLMGELLKETMIKNDYGAVEEYIPQWSEPRHDVVMVRVTAPNGFEVARFGRKAKSEYLYHLKKSIFYEGKRILDLEVEWDFGEIHSHMSRRIINLVGLSVIAVTLLGMLLWQVLKKTTILPLQKHIEERQEIEAKLEKHSNQLAMYVEELESYSYSIAHDLRAPVRSITSFSQLLELDAKDKLSQEEMDTLHRVISAGKYMAKLIDDILALAKITREDMVVEPINLSEMVSKSVKHLRELEPERDCVVTIQPGLAANGDSRLVQLLLDNLIGNAWKYTGKQDKGVIEFGMKQNSHTHVFYVKDNGVGFDMQYADKLFQPFQRLHSRQEFEGTGIGLATSRRIVSRHGGKIWVESKLNKGTTFYFTL